MTPALARLHRALLAAVDAAVAEGSRHHLTRWQIGDLVLQPLELATSAIARARTHSETRDETPSQMAERMRAYMTDVFQHYGIENEERSMDPDDDDAADFRVTRYDVPLLVVLGGVVAGIIGLVWWAVA